MTKGQILGVAGGGLNHSDGWAQNRAVARAGQRGEERTARMLDALVAAGGKATVMHDLDVPRWKNGNIDHVVVSRNTVLLIDSKSWTGGFYWTLGGRTRRGWGRLDKQVAARQGRAVRKGDDYVAKKVMADARNAVQRHLESKHQLPCSLPTPVIAIWPSAKDGVVSTWALRTDGLRYLPAEKLARVVRPLMRHRADPRVVEALYPLLVTKQ